ncbi:MAG: class II aldolase/adducin family protein [bacterium]
MNSDKGSTMIPDAEEVKGVRSLLCEAGKRLLKENLVSGTWGNISVRVGKNFMVITPSGMEYEKLTPEDMVLVSLNDLHCEGELKPSSEKQLHAEIYRNRPDVGAIIHTHSMNASTVAASRREVPPILDDMAQILGPSVRVAEYALPGTKSLAKKAVRALRGRNAVLLANHGAICVGRDLEEAFVACQILEKACKAFIESQFLGGAVPIGPVEAWLMHEVYLKKYSLEKKKKKT